MQSLMQKINNFFIDHQNLELSQAEYKDKFCFSH